MTAYNKKDLYNKYVQEQASEAFRNKCIDENTYRNILESHKQQLYTPNYFIRVGLALLTIVAILFSAILIWLITGTSSDGGVIALLVFFAILCYGLLEAMIKRKNYYNAGIDNILLTAIVIFIVSALLVNNYTHNYETMSLATMLVCLWLAIRFNDAAMSATCFVAIILFFFFVYTRIGAFGKLTAPFALMLVTALIYSFMQKLLKDHQYVIFKYCIQWVILLSLLTFYAAGNYFVVNELSLVMFNAPASMGWIFWILTLLIPPAYIFYGIKKGKSMFYRTGIVLMILSVLTVRYYYTVMPAEVAMIIFGMLLIAVSYVLIRYLAISKHGFTFENTDTEKNLINAEALIVAQVFGKKTTTHNDQFQFGGGSSGGGGATGTY